MGGLTKGDVDILFRQQNGHARVLGHGIAPLELGGVARQELRKGFTD